MNKELFSKIRYILLAKCEEIHLSHTRIHSLSDIHANKSNVFVKREDETGFGISGCKIRKYASILPFLQEHGYREVVLIGGASSNHIASMLQLLNEYNIHAHLFLKSTHQQELKGNGLLRYLLAEDSQIMWIKSEDWGRVEELAKSFIDTRKNKIYLIPEGGSCQPALAGACTLMMDIYQNEEKSGVAFDHIWIDSGTAMMAGSLCLMNQFLERQSNIHVVLNAGDRAYFTHQLLSQIKWFEELTSFRLKTFPRFHLYKPETARSFGSVNRTILDYVKRMARTEGLLLDPIYTAKLFYTAQHQMTSQNLKGNTLIIHSGGGTGLMGFGEKFKKNDT